LPLISWAANKLLKTDVERTTLWWDLTRRVGGSSQINSFDYAYSTGNPRPRLISLSQGLCGVVKYGH
jgi:hypothetical protein